MVLLYDMAIPPEWKQNGRDQQKSSRRTECHFPQSGFESTEQKAEEICSYRCVCCADPFDRAHNDGGED